MTPHPPESTSPFGGPWSDVKLTALRDYLKAYRMALKNQPFKFGYIDAFAGAGVRSVADVAANPEPTLIEDLDTTEEEIAYRHGSPLIALGVDPPFDSFIFIDKDPDSLRRLESQVIANGHGERNVRYLCNDANAELVKLSRMNWSHHRAVAFLDPFAMHLNWSTIEALSSTGGIDLWLLFPAMAVNRMLPRSGIISAAWQDKLNQFFGTESWKGAFYVPRAPDLFGESGLEKLDHVFERISRYVIQRLREIFPGVIDRPLILKNTSNTPIFLLCFACANRRGSATACRIAGHIIKTKSR